MPYFLNILKLTVKALQDKRKQHQSKILSLKTALKNAIGSNPKSLLDAGQLALAVPHFSTVLKQSCFSDSSCF